MIFLTVFNPNNELIKITLELTRNYNISPSKIFIIDDYSNQNLTKKIFDNLNKMGCKILKNNGNKGKGGAIKFSISYAKKNQINRIIFADGDGQHSSKDINSFYQYSKYSSEFLIGERNFKHTPIVRKYSNILSSFFYKVVTGYYIRDTQCGLRCISKKHFNIILDIKENDFDLELIFLLNLYLNNYKIEKQKIETIYFKTKYMSHFNKFFDTISIIKVFTYFFFKNKLQK